LNIPAILTENIKEKIRALAISSYNLSAVRAGKGGFFSEG